MFKIELTPAAHRQWRKLPRDASQTIADAFTGEFANNPLSRTLDTRKLHVPFPGYRLRVADYRILFVIGKGIVTVYSIKHRKEAYKG